MTINETKLIEVATFIITILNTLVIGIGGYFLIGKQQADMYRSETELNAIQTKLSQIHKFN